MCGKPAGRSSFRAPRLACLPARYCCDRWTTRVPGLLSVQSSCKQGFNMGARSRGHRLGPLDVLLLGDDFLHAGLGMVFPRLSLIRFTSVVVHVGSDRFPGDALLYFASGQTGCRSCLVAGGGNPVGIHFTATQIDDGLFSGAHPRLSESRIGGNPVFPEPIPIGMIGVGVQESQQALSGALSIPNRRGAPPRNTVAQTLPGCVDNHGFCDRERSLRCVRSIPRLLKESKRFQHARRLSAN